MNGLNHVAFIMDGNGRWAKAQSMPRIEGHKAGARSMEKIVPYAFEKGATVLSFYAFSTENWVRPKKEVDGILSLLMMLLERNAAYLVKNKIRLVVSGDITPLSKVRQKKITDAIEKTKDFKKTVNILFNYGGKADVLRAAKTLIEKGVTSPTEADFESALYTCGLTPVDLVIRTGGEKRLSNFMLWQTAYSELYFTDVFWPDFNKACYDAAVEWFLSRKRRFGDIETKDEKSCNCVKVIQ